MVMTIRTKYGIFAGLAVALTAAVAIAQAQNASPSQETPQPSKSGVMKMQCDIGSFLISGRGRVEINFRGTLLIYRLKGTRVVTGNVRKEFEGFDRETWFGVGKAVIEGEWRHIQWFGGDMTATWVGQGYAHTFGEYSPKSGNSGTTTIDDLPPVEWWSTGREFWVPKEDIPGYKPGKNPYAPIEE
jgi:hypothetical protein